MNGDMARELASLYAQIPPERLRHAEFFMNKNTWDDLRMRYAAPPAPTYLPSQAFGVPVKIDNTMPDGEVLYVAEMEQDRMMIRTYREAGLPVNVMQFVPFVPPPAPSPRLEALVRRWGRRIRKFFKRS